MECPLSSSTEARFRRSLPWPWHQTPFELPNQREEGSALLPMYQALDGQTLSGRVASARGVWVIFGDGFGLVRGEQLLQTTAAQAVRC